MKKITSVLTASAISLSMCTGVFAASFYDIEDERYAWAKPYIEEMADKGLVKGYEDGSYGPDNQVTKLECIAMFARAMGALDEANATILEKAHAEYDELILQYGLDWGKDEIAYMLYKGALTKSDLDTYIREVKNEPMKRYEAAIIITKAMGGESTATGQGAVSLDYADAKTIPTSALGYVDFVSDNGIMQGMEDNTFSPNTSVLRSQIAVMLARVVDKIGYEFSQVQIVDIDTSSKTVTMLNENGDVVEYAYDEDTIFKILGQNTTAENMITSVKASLSVNNGIIVSIDTLSGEADETVTGKYQGNSAISGTAYIKIIPDGQSSSRSYPMEQSVDVTYDGEPATLRSFAIGDVITIEVSDGKVYAVKGQQKEYLISGATVTSVDIDDELTLTISHTSSDYDGLTFKIADNATLKKNGLSADFSSLYAGDSVTLTIQYNEVVKAVATSTSTVIEGTVQSVSISAQPSMVVKVNGEERTYQIVNDTPITKDGKEVTAYDLRVGDNVKLTIESDVITKIVCTGTQISESGRVTGIVEAVNTSLGFIKLQLENGSSTETIFCNDTKTKLVTKTGTTKTMKTLETGSTVTAYGSVSNGAFVATLLVIED